MVKGVKPILLVLCLGLAATACSPSGAPREDEALSYHVGMARAYYRLGDYSKAIEMYSKALEINPGDAEVCLQLGILYQDNLKDMEKAAAYYREFLRLAPDAEKAVLVREWLDSSVKAASTPVPGSASRPVRVTPIPSVPAGTGKAAASLEKIENTAPRPGRDSAAAPNAPVSLRSYIVVKGDTLAGISEKFYGTRGEWKRIFEENRDTLKAPEKLKIGQTLRIPLRK